MNDIIIISIILLSTRNRSLYSIAHACHVVALHGQVLRKHWSRKRPCDYMAILLDQ